MFMIYIWTKHPLSTLNMEKTDATPQQLHTNILKMPQQSLKMSARVVTAGASWFCSEGQT